MKRAALLLAVVPLIDQYGTDQQPSHSATGAATASAQSACGAVRIYSPADISACGLIVSDLRQREVKYLDGRTKFDPAQHPMKRETSSVVPGLVYWSVEYMPPETADMFWEAIAAHTGGSARLIKTPADWLALANASHWVPTSAAEALAACTEIVAFAGPRASRIATPFLYRDAATLTGPHAESRLGPIARDLRDIGRLRAPQVQSVGSGIWDARFWMIEARRTARYRCRIGPGRLILAATDTIRGLGIFTPGP